MKKTLYILRHATAEDLGNTQLADFDRELKPTGIIEAARMGKRLADSTMVPSAIVSSPAPRASETAKIFAEQLGLASEIISLDENLYGGGPRGYLAAINHTSNTIDALMLVGHNPDISYLVEYLCRSEIGQMEKASVVQIDFENQNWAEVSSKTGDFIAYLSPNEEQTAI
jgi:phosphohistidine phosphatase